MKIEKIDISNFRQYYSNVSLDLSTRDTQNIILLGGRNGYGKTNLLLSIVWCLYGDKIAKVDDNFKKEIQKEKNYPSFMQQSLNWTAKNEGKEQFSVSILFKDVELPKLSNLNSTSNDIIITRSFHVSNMKETLSIVDAVSRFEIFDDEEEKIDFINDYVIPIDAAKFVFFDAEKISEIANLSTKDEGSFINDALGKILGLDVYENLIDDLQIYIKNLIRSGADKNLQELYIDKEKSIELLEKDIEKLEGENANIQKNIDACVKNIRNYESFISQYSKQGSSGFDRDALFKEKQNLILREKEVSEQFSNLSEILPLAILTGKLEAVKEHLDLQEKNEISVTASKENSVKIDAFIEALFNKKPEPEDSSMSLKDKLFYYDKAKKLGEEYFKDTSDFQQLQFEHDLNNSENKLLDATVNLIGSQSKDVFESTTNEFNRVKLKIDELDVTLNKIDAELENELVVEYSSKKDTANYELQLYNQKIGANNSRISKCKSDIDKFSQQLVRISKKVKLNELNSLKIGQANKHIEVLRIFLEEQKLQHKESLETNMLKELKVLMHKLNSSSNENKFIVSVRVTLLASEHGMMISLLDQNSNEIRKESLSSGEKQIYISCLIKAILQESVQSLPIFIDTPLGRLDEEHRDSLTQKYYPTLSDQVVLFSTNSEITPKRFADIKNNVSKTYLLENDGVNTSIINGYFL